MIVAAIFAVLSVIALGLALAFRSADQAKIDNLAQETHDALCAFKGDLEQRAASTAKILDDDPGDPVRIFGLSVPRAQLKSNLANQERSLASLTSLEC